MLQRLSRGGIVLQHLSARGIDPKKPLVTAARTGRITKPYFVHRIRQSVGR